MRETRVKLKEPLPPPQVTTTVFDFRYRIDYLCGFRRGWEDAKRGVTINPFHGEIYRVGWDEGAEAARLDTFENHALLKRAFGNLPVPE